MLLPVRFEMEHTPLHHRTYMYAITQLRALRHAHGDDPLLSRRNSEHPSRRLVADMTLFNHRHTIFAPVTTFKATSGRSPPTEDPQAPTLRDTTTHTTQTEHMPSRESNTNVHVHVYACWRGGGGERGESTDNAGSSGGRLR